MGKPLSALNLDPDEGPAPNVDGLKVQAQIVDKFVRELQRMENEEMYHFAYGRIVDIRITVQQTNRVTEGQQRAIQNIKIGAQRHEDAHDGWKRHEARTGRRYEGFTNRRRDGYYD